MIQQRGEPGVPPGVADGPLPGEALDTLGKVPGEKIVY